MMLVLGLAAALSLLACNPCRDLAEKICECEENSTARDNCRRSLDIFSRLKSFDEASKPDLCREILKSESCNCLAIKDGHVERCGMTR